jgi:predicted TPR repeat methyltransferase
MTLQRAATAQDVGAETVAALRARFPQLAATLDQGVAPHSALRHYGLMFWREGRLHDAVRLLEAANVVEPADPVIRSELGCLLRALGQKAEALRCFADSLELNPGQVQVWLNAASLSAEIGDRRAAEESYVQAFQLDPNCAEAAAGLGLIQVERRNFAEAARLLAIAVARGGATGPIYACLGQAHFLLGEFGKASEAFQQAKRMSPGEAWVTVRYARARFAQALTEGSFKAAKALYQMTAGAHAEPADALYRTTFQILAGFGQLEAARRLGDAMLAENPGDPIIAHQMAALRGEEPERAPRDFIVASFDAFADSFDEQLVEVLEYDVPAKMHSLLVEAGVRPQRVLDLGCGTGLAAPCLASFGADLTGVDLSPKMLDKARGRALYDRLIESDALEHLRGGGDNYDLIACYDMMIYFGDFAPLFEAVWERLAPGGVFAFSYETTNAAGFELRPSARYAHARDYVEALAAKGFDTLANVSTTLRLEANVPMAGRLMALKKR